MRALMLLLVVGLAVPVLHAGVIDEANRQTQPTETWLVWGGATTFHFDPDVMRRFGIVVERADGASRVVPGVPGGHYGTYTFPALSAPALQFNHTGGVINGVGGGALRHAGGLVLSTPDGAVDLRGFALAATPGSRFGLAVVDAGGTAWFTTDHPHYGFEPAGSNTFSMRHMDLRLAPAFARLLGNPNLAGWPVGGLEFKAESRQGPAAPAPAGNVCNAPWPGPGLTSGIQLIYRDGTNSFDGAGDSIWALRCGLPPLGAGSLACTADSTNGGVVIAPDSSLRNAGETAVAWYTMFSGTFPPYDNDQHPFLLWNMYRIGADGSIKQIGASGVKHAFYTVNDDCPCNGGNVLYPTCVDTYSLFNNDSTGYIGPRSEVIPAAGLWGRCESVFDTDCNGVEDDGGIPNDLYTFRLAATESDMLPPLSLGAEYFFEYWYVDRDDQDIFDSMGYRQVLPAKTGSNWNVSLVDDGNPADDFTLGPAVDAWVDPANPAPGTMSYTLTTPLGHARVAVRTTSLGNGQWRYTYAVMNLDYANAEIDPAHPQSPNLHVLSNHGFDRFSVPVPVSVTVSDIAFGDLDGDSGNDWSATDAEGDVTWSAPSGNTLDWGTLYSFSFTADAPPAATLGAVLYGVAISGGNEIANPVTTLAPSVDSIFGNGFESVP